MKPFSVIQEVIIANVVRAQGEGQRDSMSSEVTGHPGPTGEQTLASEVVQHSGKLWLSSPSTSLDPAVYTDCNSLRWKI